MKTRQRFDFAAKRRREIRLHANHVGAADTDDLARWLVAWTWHNRQTKDQVGAVIEAARSMGRKDFTPAEAAAVIEEASVTRRHMSADNLARFLGVTFAQRQALRLTAIGSVNVGKRARRELRKRRDKLGAERRRRAGGAKPRSEYLANSLSAKRPWEALGMSRRTWERRRRRNEVRDARPSTPIFLSSADGLASKERSAGAAEGRSLVAGPAPAATAALTARRSRN